MTTPFAPARRAFTLIELLVVISILAILMGLLFPAVSGALEQAKKVQAKNEATQIANAVNAYVTEYGKMPVGDGSDVSDANDNEAFWDALSPNAKTPPTSNPRGIVFLEVPSAKKGKNGRVDGKGAYMDSWGKPYLITLDGDFDNTVKGPASTSGGSSEVRKTVIVWSEGNTTNTKKAKDPEKFIKSWE